MHHAVTIEGNVTDDGRLEAEIPEDAPRGRVRVTLVSADDASEDLASSDRDLHGLGLSAADIAQSPEMGSWGSSAEVPDGAVYVDRLRHGSPRYRW